MSLRPGDLIRVEGELLEVLGRSVFRAGRAYRVRLQRPGDPANVRDVILEASDRVEVKRTA